MMNTSEFFDGIVQAQALWRDTTVRSPLFYQDVRMLAVSFVAPLKKVSTLLPSKRLYPLRVTPWHTIVLIIAYEYRACDIGPYNEVAILTPVSLDHKSPLFTGLLRPIPAEPHLYIFHLPVTTEIACELGIEVGGYPKFIADIEFKEERDCVSCCLSDTGQHILTVTVPKGNPRPVPRLRTYPVNARSGRLLQSVCIVSEREESSIKNPRNAKLELGDHQISQQLKDLHLGKIGRCQYVPYMQMILSSVLESFAI